MSAKGGHLRAEDSWARARRQSGVEGEPTAFCPHCGNRVHPEHNFCRRCGSPLRSPSIRDSLRALAPTSQEGFRLLGGVLRQAFSEGKRILQSEMRAFHSDKPTHYWRWGLWAFWTGLLAMLLGRVNGAILALIGIGLMLCARGFLTRSSSEAAFPREFPGNPERMWLQPAQEQEPLVWEREKPTHRMD